MGDPRVINDPRNGGAVASADSTDRRYYEDIPADLYSRVAGENVVGYFAPNPEKDCARAITECSAEAYRIAAHHFEEDHAEPLVAGGVLLSGVIWPIAGEPIVDPDPAWLHYFSCPVCGAKMIVIRRGTAGKMEAERNGD